MKTYIIYEIKCNDANVEFNYVGHTTNFRNRKNRHKTRCNNVNDKLYNLKIYKCIRENGNWYNWTMSPLEEYECETTIQARIREQYWMDIKQAKLNSVRAFTTTEQRKERKKETTAQYRIDNEEQIKVKRQQFHIDNKEHLNERSKKYHTENREVILARQKQIIVCECGVCITTNHKSRHIKSKQHLELMSKLNL